MHISLHAALALLAAAPAGAPAPGAPAAAGTPAAEASAAGGALRARLDAGLPGVPAGAARALWASSLLRGAPYRASPLGEGAGADPDPRFRLDAFDCVTLVETAMALGAAGSVADAGALLDRIRYDGAPAWATRRHYAESQWLPGLVRDGWLEPLGAGAVGVPTVRVERRLDDDAWREAERAGRALPGLGPGARPEGTFALEVVPLSALLEAAPRMPEGTLLVVVREPRPARPSLVTHMGLLVRAPGGGLALRHASDVPGVLRVRDEPLDAAVRRMARRSWKVVGVAAYRLRTVTDR